VGFVCVVEFMVGLLYVFVVCAFSMCVCFWMCYICVVCRVRVWCLCSWLMCVCVGGLCGICVCVCAIFVCFVWHSTCFLCVDLWVWTVSL